MSDNKIDPQTIYYWKLKNKDVWCGVVTGFSMGENPARIGETKIIETRISESKDDVTWSGEYEKVKRIFLRWHPFKNT